MGIFRSDRSRTTAEVAESVGGAVATIAPARTISLVKGSGPATQRADIESAGGKPDLVKRFDKAGVSLSKRGLDGIRAQVRLYVDHSLSMSAAYSSGLVQTIADRFLALGLQVDVDGGIEVIAWDNVLHPSVDVTVSNYADVVNRSVYRPSQMGGTELLPVFRDIITTADTTDAPLLAVILTDGAPTDDGAQLRELALATANYPVFIKFLTTVDSAFAEWLDDEHRALVGKRLLDNCDAKNVANIDALSDLEFADVVTDEWGGWVGAAQGAGLLT